MVEYHRLEPQLTRPGAKQREAVPERRQRTELRQAPRLDDHEYIENSQIAPESMKLEVGLRVLPVLC